METTLTATAVTISTSAAAATNKGQFISIALDSISLQWIYTLPMFLIAKSSSAIYAPFHLAATLFHRLLYTIVGVLRILTLQNSAITSPYTTNSTLQVPFSAEDHYISDSDFQEIALDNFIISLRQGLLKDGWLQRIIATHSRDNLRAEVRSFAFSIFELASDLLELKQKMEDMEIDVLWAPYFGALMAVVAIAVLWCLCWCCRGCGRAGKQANDHGKPQRGRRDKTAAPVVRDVVKTTKGKMVATLSPERTFVSPYEEAVLGGLAPQSYDTFQRALMAESLWEPCLLEPAFSDEFEELDAIVDDIAEQGYTHERWSESPKRRISDVDSDTSDPGDPIVLLPVNQPHHNTINIQTIYEEPPDPLNKACGSQLQPLIAGIGAQIEPSRSLESPDRNIGFPDDEILLTNTWDSPPFHTDLENSPIGMDCFEESEGISLSHQKQFEANDRNESIVEEAITRPPNPSSDAETTIFAPIPENSSYKYTEAFDVTPKQDGIAQELPALNSSDTGNIEKPEHSRNPSSCLYPPQRIVRDGKDDNLTPNDSVSPARKDSSTQTNTISIAGSSASESLSEDLGKGNTDETCAAEELDTASGAGDQPHATCKIEALGETCAVGVSDSSVLADNPGEVVVSSSMSSGEGGDTIVTNERGNSESTKVDEGRKRAEKKRAKKIRQKEKKALKKMEGTAEKAELVGVENVDGAPEDKITSIDSKDEGKNPDADGAEMGDVNAIAESGSKPDTEIASKANNDITAEKRARKTAKNKRKKEAAKARAVKTQEIEE
ncbi:hypothetical protein ABW19_dt0202450 [Dactylella cylindrospora]|nr:hypothetical protein ABW19_dt0202450 [Dactylella cylindrospora]